MKRNLRSTCSSHDSVSYLCCFPVGIRAHVSLTSNLEANTCWPASTKPAVERDHKILEHQAEGRDCTGFVVLARLKKGLALQTSKDNRDFLWKSLGTGSSPSLPAFGFLSLGRAGVG